MHICLKQATCLRVMSVLLLKGVTLACQCMHALQQLHTRVNIAAAAAPRLCKDVPVIKAKAGGGGGGGGKRGGGFK